MNTRKRTNGDVDDATTRAPHNVPVDIGPAWLLLSHGAFLAAIGVGTNSAFVFLIANPAFQTLAFKSLAVAQSGGSVLIGLWTIYAIHGTWRENMKLKSPTYGDIGFVALIIIVLYLIGLAVATGVEVLLYPIP